MMKNIVKEIVVERKKRGKTCSSHFKTQRHMRHCIQIWNSSGAAIADIFSSSSAVERHSYRLNFLYYL